MSEKREFDVVLYGATGFTGKLIAGQLAKRGLRFAIGGRNKEKLQALAATLSPSPQIITASVDEPDKLVAMARRGAVLVTAAGPFGVTGMPVARAAVAAGAHYLDTTGSTNFMRQVVEELDGPARDAGVAMSPAMGFDVVPGDLAAHYAAEALKKDGKKPSISRAEVIYNILHPAITRGTFKSMLEGRTGKASFLWRGGTWEEIEAWEDVTPMTFPGEDTEKLAVLTELAETLTVSRALKADTVDTYILTNKLMHGVMKAIDPIGRALLDSPARDVINELVERIPEGPGDAAREKNHYHILSRVTAKDGRTAEVIASGKDPYGLTGEALAVYAELLSKPSYKKKGVLSPSTVAPPDKAISMLKEFPISFSEPVMS